MKNGITLFLKGMAMGIAEVIPGVSGGTIAFITGIYEKLLETIKSILGPGVIEGFRAGGLFGAWKRINGNFLIVLLAGMATGLITGVFTISHLLEVYPQLVWAFFFGLIIASVIYIGRRVGRWTLAEAVALILATAFAYYITVANPAQGNEALWFVFISGMIAISALILPGISGSFVLLLMGMYTYIIPTLRDALRTLDPAKILIIFVFGLGCLVGLASFSRVLSWTFKNYYSQTMAALTGFMLGSLNKLWPWRNVMTYRQSSDGEMVPFLEKAVMPVQYEGDPMVPGVLGLIVLGMAIVLIFDYVDRKKEIAV